MVLAVGAPAGRRPPPDRSAPRPRIRARLGGPLSCPPHSSNWLVAHRKQNSRVAVFPFLSFGGAGWKRFKQRERESRVEYCGRRRVTMSRRSSVSTHSSLDVAEPRRATSVLGITSVALGGLAAIATFTAWPFPTTVPVWIALLVGSSIWCLGAWIKVLSGLGRVEGYAPVPQEYGEKIHRRERRGMRWVLGGVTVVLVAVACVGVVPPKREMPERRQTQEPVLIAANLYNVEGIWDAWREEIVSLITHRTFLYPPFDCRTPR